MKIEKIVIENIASLRGHNEIDFKSITNENNLFAITGPTGSGKSTILNCISLALYGKVYKTTLNQKDLVTLGETQGLIQLYFKVAANDYLVEWTCRVRQKNGKLLKKADIPPRKLYKQTEDDFSILEKTPEDILGLDYEQFCKTTILNQGEFSRFLTSSFTERKSILEKLYASDYLNKLSPTLFSQIKDLNNEVENINDKIGVLSFISDEEIIELKNKLSNNEKILGPIEEIIKLQIGVRDLLKENEQHLEKRKNNFERINKYKEEVKDISLDKNKKSTIVSNLNKELQSLESKYKKERPKLLEAIKKHEVLVSYKQQISKSHEKLDKNISEIKELDSLIENTNKSINDSILESQEIIKKIKCNDLGKLNNKDIEIEFKQLELLATKLEKNRIELSTLTNENVYNKEKLEEKKHQINQITEKIEQYKKETPLLFGNFSTEELNNQKTNINTELTKINFLLNQLNENNNLLKNYKDELKNSISSIQSLEQDITHLNDQLKDRCDYNNSIKEVTALRSVIEKTLDIENCLVCDSHVNHNKLRSKLADLSEKDKLKDTAEIEKKLSNASSELTKLQASSEHINLQIKKITESTQSILLDINQFKLRESYNKELNGGTEQIKDIINIGKTQLDKISSQIVNIEKSKLNFEKDQIALKHTQRNLNEIENKQNYINNKIAIINKEISSNDNDFKATESKLKELFPQYVNELTQEFESDKDNYHLYKIKNFEQKSFEQKLEHYLENKKKINTNNKLLLKEIEDLSKTSEQLEKEIKILSGGLDPNNVLNNFEQDLAKYKDKLKSQESIYNKLKNNLVDLESRLDMLNEQNQQIIQTYQLRHIKLVELCNKLEVEYSRHSSINTVANTELLSKFTSKIKHLNNIEEVSRVIYSESISLFSTITTQIEEAVKEIRASIIEIKSTLAQEEKRKSVKNELMTQKEKITKKLDLKKKLQQLVGKDEFRNYVLGQIELNLLRQTNHELKQLYNGRYQLIQHGTNRPEYFVLDKFKGGLKRKVATLSGGETFLVSLAMALGLAEMTRGSTVIDSFFIDEGFGTLDSDSLEEVIEILNGLKDKGKMIGIISHIKDLTNRIPLNINLAKDQSGSSSIGFIFN